MGQLSVHGLNELIKDLESAANIPDQVSKEMLTEGAEIIAKAHKKKLDELGIYDTHDLMDSIKPEDGVKLSGSGRYVEIYPHGTRENGVRNAEVGFIHEYGAPHKHIPAKNWMKKANDESKDKAVEAAKKVFDDFLNSKNL